MMQLAYNHFDDVDGNFLEQFQTTAFDSRTFELYLSSYLQSSNYTVRRPAGGPDFILINPAGVTVALEATTSNPGPNHVPSQGLRRLAKLSEEELRFKLEEEIPIRLGSPLFSKLNRRYWEMPSCQGLPLIIAIEAFHEEGALFFSENSLGQYLYGLRHSPEWAEDGRLIVRSQTIEEHKAGSKVIPSSFFRQPDAENISAILFTNSGTYAKFLRMGYQAGYHFGNLKITRHGTCYDRDPNSATPLQFGYDMDDPPFEEPWSLGLMLFLNDNARIPVPKDFFVGAARSYMEDGVLTSDLPPFYPYMSITRTLVLTSPPRPTPKPPVVRRIMKAEFGSRASSKHPIADLILHEREWFATEGMSVVGALILDLVDQDWSFVVFSVQPDGTHKLTDFATSFATRRSATRHLISSIRRHVSATPAA